MRSHAAASLLVALSLSLAAWSPKVAVAAPGDGVTTPPSPGALGPDDICARAPAYAEESSYFASADVENHATMEVPSHGDLWPSCSSGDTLYTAWGDGFGFGGHEGKRPAIGVAAVRGLPTDPGGLHGRNLAVDRPATQNIFRVWTAGHYQKPTGMLCRGGKIYLAVQDLNPKGYDDAPAATIAESGDGGVTWTEDAAPMFTNFVFTTVMFLDNGPDGRNDPSGYAYAYGLDFNWRASPRVASPQALYLARIAPGQSPRDRSAWEFFSGDARTVAWSHDIRSRKPVLVDCSRRHATDSYRGEPVLSQGGIIYDAPLHRYLYTSWSKSTFEFYEAPAPWGPWRHFLTKDFGPPPWTDAKYGGYGTTTPSAYVSPDGKTLWLQSNTFSSGVTHYGLSFRKLTLEPRPPFPGDRPLAPGERLHGPGERLLGPAERSASETP